MNILVLIHRLPCPADRGAKQRVARQVAYLAERHDVWLAGFLDDDGQEDEAVRFALSKWKERCRSVYAEPLKRPLARLRALRALSRGLTASEGYFTSPALTHQIRQWSRCVSFDAVLAFSSSMAPPALSVPAMRHVLEFDDFDSGKWRAMAKASRSPLRWIYGLEARRLARRECRWLEQAEAGVLVNAREVAAMAEPSLQSKLHVIPAGIPLDHPWQTEEAFSPPPLPAEPIVTFIGAMDYAPNVDAVCWFARHVWPRITAMRPDADFWIVGRSPTRKVRRLADGRRIHVSGTVPEIRPWLEQSRVIIAPLRLARGVQIKVLMAMAAGRPCVVSSAVAEGIAARHERDWIVADEARDVGQAVLELLGNDVAATRLGQAAWSYVKKHHRTVDGCRKLEQLLAGADTQDVPLRLDVPAPALCAG